MGASLASIENAPVSLQPLEMVHSFVTPRELSSRLGAHYRRQALSQIYLILGASDIIGNPVGVLSSLRQGVRDFVMKPWRGLTKWSPGAFGAGVAMGTLSLARSSLHGVAYGATRALLALTRGTIAGSSVVGAVDTHMGGQRLRPTTLLEGVRLALVGIVTEPDRGFRTNGLLGLSRGLGAGLLGVLLKPTVGALSQVGGWTAALAASLDPAYDREAKLRMHRERPPRFFRPGSEFARLLPYRAEENRGKELIHRLRQGRHRGEGHVFHCDVAGGLTVLVTRWRLMLLHTSKTPAATAHGASSGGGGGGGGGGSSSGPGSNGAVSSSSSHFLGVEWEVSLDQILAVSIESDDDEHSIYNNDESGGDVDHHHHHHLDEATRAGGGGGGACVRLICLPTSPSQRHFGATLMPRHAAAATATAALVAYKPDGAGSRSAQRWEEVRSEEREDRRHGSGSNGYRNGYRSSDGGALSHGLATDSQRLVCVGGGGGGARDLRSSSSQTSGEARAARRVAQALVKTLTRLSPSLREDLREFRK
jgi:hypothetical protein